MNPELRLAEVLSALDQLGWQYLVMGGHAARYYGISRNTADYDLHVSVQEWSDIGQTLGQTSLFADTPFIEGPTWRPNDFRRFQIGRLVDGREEWLEFWRRNHLLPPFDEAFARREVGSYGSRLITFLGLSDLIRSKETERESDWRDIELLEEILDARNFAQPSSGESTELILSQLRSRRGFRRAFAENRFENLTTVAVAYQKTTSPITRAWLLPALSRESVLKLDSGVIGEVLTGPICGAKLGSDRHLALVEAVRRLYKQAAIATDRADKAMAIG